MVTDKVVPKILWMQSDRLRHGTDFPAHLFQVQVPQITSVVIHRASGGPVDSKREPEQGALAGAGLARDRDKLAGPDVNRYIVENQRTVRLVSERNAVEQNFAAQSVDRFSLDVSFRNRGEQRAHLLECRQHGGNGAERLAEPGNCRLECNEDGVDNEEIADRDVPVAHDDHREQQHSAGEEGERGRKCTRMRFERAQFQFGALLLAIVPRPDGVSRSFRAFHSQFDDTAHDLEQPAGHAAGCVDHAPVR